MEILQVPEEIDGLKDVLVREGVLSFLEIGSKFGGSLWKIGSALPVGSRIVSVDLPQGTKAWKESSKSLEKCIQDLKKLGQDAHLSGVIAAIRR